MSWVYFIQHGQAGAIKIGTTRGNPYARMRDLQTGAPESLRLVGAIRGDVRLERKLHEKFAAMRVRPDGEWFRPEPALLWFIDGARLAMTEFPEDDGSDEMAAHDAFLVEYTARRIVETISETCGQLPRTRAELLLSEAAAHGLDEEVLRRIDDLCNGDRWSEVDDLAERVLERETH